MIQIIKKRFSLLHNIIVFLLITYQSQGVNSSDSHETRLEDLEYDVFPKRKSEEAAMIEWGNSAVLQAIDAAVAKFGQQTSDGAYFEVEASIVLAEPIDGMVTKGEIDVQTAKLRNAEEVFGNMVIMTNSGTLEDVELAKLAQNTGAAALMVVNTKNVQNPDYIYSMEAREGDEYQEKLAKDITIPIVMVSLTSANLITSAEEDETAAKSAEEQSRAYLPDRIRLYSSHDRPFFEDVSAEDPVVYIIHNLLTDTECDALIDKAKGLTEPFDSTKSNLLEGINAIKSKSENVETVHLWKGSLLRGNMGKEIDDRIEHSTGFQSDNLSDFQIYKHNPGSVFAPHIDVLPSHAKNIQLATITIFLNDIDPEDGGEIVYPQAKSIPIKIKPKKGMAVVHHNVENEGSSSHDVNDNAAALDIQTVDLDSISAELIYKGQKSSRKEKWIAKRYFHSDPLPRSKKMILPILALPFGKLPKSVYTLHSFVMEQVGMESGENAFDQLVIFIFLSFLFILVNIFSFLLMPKKSQAIAKKEAATTTSSEKKKSKSNQGKGNKID